MITRWLEIFNDPRLKVLSIAQRVNASNGILLAESEETANPTEPMRWFGVTDMGMMSEDELRQTLLPYWGYAIVAEIDDIMIEFSLHFGKVVTPTDQTNIPPYYLINGVRECIYQLRLRVKALHIDEWNTWSKDLIIQRLVENGDQVQAL